MYAIVEFKGNQFSVEPNQILRVPYLDMEDKDKEFEISEVLVLNDDDKIKYGRPYIKNVKVLAEFLEHGKDKKIVVFKKKRRKGFSKKQGHRQKYSIIKIKDIMIEGD